MRSTGTAADDLIAVPAEDASEMVPFLRVGPIGGVDERVIILDDHSRGGVARQLSLDQIEGRTKTLWNDRLHSQPWYPRV